MNRFVLACLSISLLVPSFSHAQTSPTTSVQTLTGTLASLQAQLQLLKSSQVALSTPLNKDEEEWKFNYSKNNLKLGTGKEDDTENEDSIRRYLVKNNRLYENGKSTKKTDTDEYKIWNIFAKIAGDVFVDEYITRYATYRKADSGVLGFVRLLDTKGFQWGLAVNANAANFSSEKWSRDLAAVLIHEYAHVLTLNGDQVNHKRKQESVCKGTYFTNKGCSEKESYINNYVIQFWDEEDFSRKTPAKEKYFKEHPDEFISEYGLKSPEEDIAESFTQFILYEKPTGATKKDLKVLFFYGYPELVEERARIRSEVQQYFVK